MNIWFTSDTHYSHKNIIKGTTSWTNKSVCRPFDTLEEHNHFLLESINNCVKENDILYHLGDWSFGGWENVFVFRKGIRCKTIHLIYGNHDQHIQSNKENSQAQFSSVHDYLELSIDKKRSICMFHYPIDSWKSIAKGWIHLFGHQHSDRIGPGKCMDVGIDKSGHLVQPYHLDEILSIMDKQELKMGHHDSKIEVK
jgi:calcineurin-like phosphoesterase family protein